ncbi:MAG: NAD(P)H-dependent oxidoreductase [Bacteroidaceae bacterium]|nr:NAD(P)H-dependent oxidoreductase [Bacteroidaceae bacterium]
MKRQLFLMLTVLLTAVSTNAKTLVVYYSYTNNIHQVVSALTSQIDADVIRIEPAEKGLNYAANNYAIGSAQISTIRKNPNDASSYPAIDPVEVNLADYDCIIIGAPLWWSNMAAPLQTFLFRNGAAMAGKHIGLIVSSASSGISGVESDARRLIPNGDFFPSSLWIRSSQTANSATLIRQWLKAIDYETTVNIEGVKTDKRLTTNAIYSISGSLIGSRMSSTDKLNKGIYIINGIKTYKSY